MKKTQKSRQMRNTNSQKGAVKNWLTGKKLRQQQLTLFFVLGFAMLGSYLVFTTFAASKPGYWGNAGYWIGRVRACESGDGVWGEHSYERPGGAYDYNDKDWNNYGGFSEARLAPSNIQDDKFIADWNNQKVGSKPWKDSESCWKPLGSIRGAPCLPVPKTPVFESETNQNDTDNQGPTDAPEENNEANEEDAVPSDAGEQSTDIPVSIPE